MIASTFGLTGMMLLALGPARAQAATAQAAALSPATTVQREVTVDGVLHTYAVYLPPGYFSARQWPCIVFLHGSGECGTDGKKQTTVGLPAALQAHPERWPFIVVMPQKPLEEQEWEEHEALVMAALEQVTEEFNVDPMRITLTGISQGGHGTWTIAAHNPELFCALVPVCGYGSWRTVAPRVAHLPVWAFHGLKDTVVDPKDTRRIVEAIRSHRSERGFDPEEARVTLYPKLTHGCWDAAYGEVELPRWILAQMRRP